MKPKILLVDDDARFCELLVCFLREQNFEALSVESGQAMTQKRRLSHFDLLLLDLNMPDEDGLSICRRLRAQGDRVPIIMLTDRGGELDRISGLELGADDYVTKTAPARELVARLRSVLRRCGIRKEKHPDEPFRLAFGPFVVDESIRQLLVAGQPAHLTGDEFNLLVLLAKCAGQPLTRDQLAEALRGCAWLPEQRGIDMLISRLRKRIEVDPKHPCYLQTIRGVGYVFIPHPPMMQTR